MPTRRKFLMAALGAGLPLSALIVDGRHNHDWRATTPELKRILEEAGFSVAVATAPASNDAMTSFQPDFSRYRLVLPNYTDFGNGGAWSITLQEAFEHYVRMGGGVAIVHAASSAFPDWKEYNQIAGLGGWAGRDENSGPYIRYNDGIIKRDGAPGKAGHHGTQHEFQVTAAMPLHPILTGLPPAWTSAKDELFDSLRGPAENLELLATAWSDPAHGGSGRHEPALFTVRYGRGRIFHTILGHSVEAMRSQGFAITLQRGAEWAAAGRVIQPLPPAFVNNQQDQSRIRNHREVSTK